MGNALDLGGRVLAAFVLLLVAVRLLGKKQISQFSYFNYINGIAIGSIAANGLFIRSGEIWKGLYLVAVWGALTWLVSYLAMKSMLVRKFVEGIPRYMIRDGRVIEKNLRKEYVTVEDLTSLLRQNNNFSVGDVENAILELNGSLSVQSKSENQLVTRGDLKMGKKRLGIALPLLADGEVLDRNLQANGLERSWLDRRLEELGVTVEEVFYMELGTDGQIKVERKEDPPSA